MRRLIGPGARLLAMIWLAFLPLGFFLPRTVLFEILNALCISTNLGVVVMFWQGEWSILARPPSSWRAGDVLILGLVMTAFGLAVGFSGAWIDRAMGVAHSSGTIVGAFARWLIASGGALELIAAGSEDGTIPTRAYRQAGIVVAIGLGAALVLMSLGVA